MNALRAFATICLFLFLCVMGVQTIEKARNLQNLKGDAAELNHFKYGLFNVDAWKEQLSQIISDEIDKLYLTRKHQTTLRTHLEKQLEILIDKIYERIKDVNSKSVSGRLKQSIIDTPVDVKEIKKGVPEYSKAMFAEISSPKTEASLKKMLKDRIQKYIKETYDTRPVTLKEVIMKDLGQDSVEDAKVYLDKHISREHKVLSDWAWFMIAAAVLIFLIVNFSPGPLPWHQYAVLSLSLLVLLAVGVTTPMIDMEAKIESFKFVLIDHTIEFKDQILFFQSKSVINVFNLMIHHKEAAMKAVGILMVSFSIIFPAIKLLACVFYFYNFFGLAKNKLVQFFVLKSGKWSMADVMVIAIFMAYIGFNGIVNSQLQQIASYTDKVDLMTTNGTSLQPGFYVFFAYTILAIFLSQILERKKTTGHKSGLFKRPFFRKA